MRVVFHAIDGTGLGHMVRTSLIARALGERAFGLQALLCTNAARAEVLSPLLADPRFRLLRLPYTNLDEAQAGDDPTPRRVNSEAFASAARAFEPDLLVFDTHVPKPLLRVPGLSGCARALVLRSVTDAAREALLSNGVLSSMDRVLVPGDFGVVPWTLPPPLQARVVNIPPLLRDASTSEQREAARARRGIPPDAPLIVATLGGGGGQLAPGKRAVLADADAFAQAVVEALSALVREARGLRAVAQIGPYATVAPSAPGVAVETFAEDFPALLESSDVAVAMAGYNAAHELVRAGVPTLWLCKEARHESQRARAEALVALGASPAALARPALTELLPTLRAFWFDPARRAACERATRELAHSTGLLERDCAASAAEALAELVRRDVPTLGPESPCDDPCEGCPALSPRPLATDGATLVADGERRVRIPCAAGRDGNFEARLLALEAAGLSPVIETTGRMADTAPHVQSALASDRARELLLFGLGKKVHQRASRRAGTLGSTRDLARSTGEHAPFVRWRIATRRFGVVSTAPVRPIERALFFGRRDPSDLPAVALLRKRWLPFSETFVHAEARALTRHRPIAVCKDAEGDWPDVPRWPLGDIPPDRAALALREAGVVLAHAAFATCAAAFRGLVDALEVPLVVSVRGHDLYRREPEREALLAAVFERAAVLLARSEEMASDLRRAGAAPDKVRVLRTPLDLARFAFSAPNRAPGPKVLTVGRFTQKKGLPEVVRAFAALKRHHAQASLIIVGRGHVDEDPAVVREVEALANDLGPAVTLHEAMPQEGLAALYAECDLYLCAPRVASDGDREGLPNAVKEAMAIGRPIVTYDAPALGRLVRGDDDALGPAGLVAPAGDLQSLSQALIEVAAHPERWLDYGQRGRARVSTLFAMGSCVAELEALYTSLRG